MKLKKNLAFIVLCLILFLPSLAHLAGGDKQKVYVIPISGTVEPGMAAYVKRALRDIKDDKDAVFLSG